MEKDQLKKQAILAIKEEDMVRVAAIRATKGANARAMNNLAINPPKSPGVCGTLETCGWNDDICGKLKSCDWNGD